MDVKELRIKANITQDELSYETGIPRDRIGKWEQGKGKPKADDSNILKAYFISKGVWEEIPGEGNFVKENAESYLTKRLQKKNNNGPVMVPLVSVKAQAGYTRSYNDSDYIKTLEYYPIVPGVDPHGAIWRYFQVEGDSMKETFNDGDYVLGSQVSSEDWPEIKDFLVYVIVTADRVFIKRIAKRKGGKQLILISDNEKIEQIAVNVNEILELWKYRRHIGWNAAPPKRFEIKI